MIHTLAISGYRSIRDLAVPLGQLTVVTGANGAGKSSLYRALRLLADVAQGRVIQSIAAEGGLDSTLWAGPESFSHAMKTGEAPVQGAIRKSPIALRMGFASDEFGYAIDLGLGVPGGSAFNRDPVVKAESLWIGDKLLPRNAMAERRGPSVRVRDDNGAWVQSTQQIPTTDSLVTYWSDPRSAPELSALRERLRAWRFYDHLSTDRSAPARRPQVGTFTPVLAADGSDLAAAVQTIREIGDAVALETAIEDAFPGSTINVASGEGGYFELEIRQHGLLRALKAAEVSDGTLRFLMLAVALLSPRSPALMVLNEPETSLHESLLPALGRLILQAANKTQIVVVSHAAALVSTLGDADGTLRIVLEKRLGETIAPGIEKPSWRWPDR
jgi:predicted ATPase